MYSSAQLVRKKTHHSKAYKPARSEGRARLGHRPAHGAVGVDRDAGDDGAVERVDVRDARA